MAALSSKRWAKDHVQPASDIISPPGLGHETAPSSTLAIPSPPPSDHASPAPAATIGHADAPIVVTAAPAAAAPSPEPTTPTKTTTSVPKMEKIGPLADFDAPARAQSSSNDDMPATPPMTATSSPPLMTTPLPTDENDKDRLIRELQEALQTERSVVRVLQGQKEAISKDLDYLSLTVDELMDEKEAIVQEYEKEKMMVQSKEEDLNLLLEKLKSSTDSARDRCTEAEQLRLDLDTERDKTDALQAQVREQQATIDDLQAQVDVLRKQAKKDKAAHTRALQEKEDAYQQSQDDLAMAMDDIARLEAQLEHETQEKAASPAVVNMQHVASTIETPNASPRLDPVHDPHQNDPQKSPVPTSRPSRIPSRVQTLDTQLKALLQEKEELQSDYGKIPLSGGGPMSRQRLEDLEDKLDNVDSRISSVRQQIKKTKSN
ncbi:hypothetical protein BC940DRAFT_308658 [Gongronella butleri]|nr:hypothetical protein BC940DRAFT_308658 [Gongronella butleri]